MSVLREDGEIRRAEHEVEAQHLQERVQHLADQLQKTQGLLYDSKLLKYVPWDLLILDQSYLIRFRYCTFTRTSSNAASKYSGPIYRKPRLTADVSFFPNSVENRVLLYFFYRLLRFKWLILPTVFDFILYRAVISCKTIKLLSTSMDLWCELPKYSHTTIFHTQLWISNFHLCG